MFLKKLVLGLMAFVVFATSWRLGAALGFGIGGLGVIAIALILAFLSAIAFLLFGRHEFARAPVPMDASVVLFGVFVAVNFASMGWAAHPDVALSSSINYFQLLIFVWLLAFLRSEKYAFQILIHAYLLGVTVLVVGSLIEAAALGDVLQDMRSRNFGIDRNVVAFKTVLGIPIAVYLFQRSSASRYRWLYLSYVALSLVAIVLTGSRTGLLTLGFILAVLTWSLVSVEKSGSVRLSATRTIVVFAALAVLVASLVPFLAEHLPRHVERFSTLADITESGVGGRMNLWVPAFEVYLNNLLLGVGSGGGGLAFLPYFEGGVYVFSFLDSRVSLHSVFLEVATGTGTVGLLLFLAVIVALIMRTLAFERPERMLFLSLIGASLIMALTLSLNDTRDFFFALFLPVLLSVSTYPVRAKTRPAENLPSAQPRREQEGVHPF